MVLVKGQEFEGKEWRHRCRKWTVDTVQEGESEINGESSTT